MKRTNRVMLLGSLMLVMMLALGGRGSAASRNLVNERFPIEGVVYNVCLDEEVAFSGVQHIIVRQEQLPDGSFLYTIKYAVHLTGEGLDSGLQYVGNETGQFTENAPAEGGFVHDQTFYIRLITLGKAPNELLHSHFTFAVSPNDEVSFNEEFLDLKCNGASAP